LVPHQCPRLWILWQAHQLLSRLRRSQPTSSLRLAYLVMSASRGCPVFCLFAAVHSLAWFFSATCIASVAKHRCFSPRTLVSSVGSDNWQPPFFLFIPVFGFILFFYKRDGVMKAQCIPAGKGLFLPTAFGYEIRGGSRCRGSA
jgi:hypothetical protein